jgi:hypothetical protein
MSREVNDYLQVQQLTAKLKVTESVSKSAAIRYFSVAEVKVKATLRLAVGQSVCLGVEPALGLVTRYFYCLKVAVLSLWGALSDERSSLSFQFCVATLSGCVLILNYQGVAGPKFTNVT